MELFKTTSEEFPDLNYKSISNQQVYLPLEILTHIFEFLSYPDRIAASQVCTLWYEASLNQKFLSKEKVVFKKINSEAVLHILNTFEKSNRPYLHFLLIEVELSSKVKDFWIKTGPVLSSLSMDKCDIAAKTFVEILSNFYNLECLEIIDCRELLMAGQLLEKNSEIKQLQEVLKHLKELNLGCNRYLSDVLFNRLMSIAPNLESFSLAGCQISFHSGLYKKFYPSRLTDDDEFYASETVLTFWNILKYLETNSKRIRQIDLSKTLIDNKALIQISAVKNLKLKELYLVSCEQISNAGVISIAEIQSNLTALNLSYCSRVTDQALIRICNSLVHLKKLGIRNCWSVTDLGVACLSKLQKLEEVDLSQCENVSGVGIEEGLCSRDTNKCLKKLYLEGLNTITSETVIKLAKCLPAVTHLNLSFCFNAVTDKSVQSIIEFQTSLRSLQLVACSALTDAGLTGMGINMDSVNVTEESMKQQELLINTLNGMQPRLHISLRSPAEEEIVRDAYRKKAVQKMCETHVKAGEQKGYSLRRLKGLQDLNLRSCNRITDVSLEYAFCFPELQHLNLSQCQQISHVGLEHVGMNNHGIDTLNLSQCSNVTDEGIISLTKSLHRLKILDIQGCNQLTDVSKKAIAVNCKYLRYLDIRSCTRMTLEISEISQMASLQTLKRNKFFTHTLQSDYARKQESKMSQADMARASFPL